MRALIVALMLMFVAAGAPADAADVDELQDTRVARSAVIGHVAHTNATSYLGPPCPCSHGSTVLNASDISIASVRRGTDHLRGLVPIAFLAGVAAGSAAPGYPAREDHPPRFL